MKKDHKYSSLMIFLSSLLLCDYDQSKHLMENLTGDKFNLYLSCSIMETLRRLV